MNIAMGDAMIEIRHRYTNGVLYKTEKAKTIKEAVEEAVRQGISLNYSNLRDSKLRYSNLSGSNLSNANYDIMQVLQCSWGEVSKELCVQLMRLDCGALPGGEESFNKWAHGGSCPFEKTSYRRIVYFEESSELWKKHKNGEIWTLWEIWKQIAKERGIKITEQ